MDSLEANQGVVPFERFYLGGDGLANFSMDGRETIQLRGYPNNSLTPVGMKEEHSKSNNHGFKFCNHYQVRTSLLSNHLH
jgi:hypothetical protein